MPVAVRLIEVLTLVTLLGLLTGFSIFIVLVQRAFCLVLFLLNPLTRIVGSILYASEKIIVGTLMSILNLTSVLGSSNRN